MKLETKKIFLIIINTIVSFFLGSFLCFPAVQDLIVSSIAGAIVAIRNFYVDYKKYYPKEVL